MPSPTRTEGGAQPEAPISTWLRREAARAARAPKTTDEALAAMIFRPLPHDFGGLNRLFRARLEGAPAEGNVKDLLDALEFSTLPVAWGPALPSDLAPGAPADVDLSTFLAVSVRRDPALERAQTLLLQRVCRDPDELPTAPEAFNAAFRGGALTSGRLWHDEVDTRVFVHLVRPVERFVLPRHRAHELVAALSAFARFGERLAGFERRAALFEEYRELVRFMCGVTGVPYEDVCGKYNRWRAFVDADA